MESWDQRIAALRYEATVHEINMLPLPECLLLDGLDGLTDGKVFARMLHAAARTNIQQSAAERLLRSDLGAVERLSGVLHGLHGVLSEPSLSALVTVPGAAQAMHDGDAEPFERMKRETLDMAIPHQEHLHPRE